MQSVFVLGTSPQIPVPPAAAGGFVPRPPKHHPIAYFWLRAWSFYCCCVILCELILRLAGVYGFPQAAVSLNKFAHLDLFKPDRLFNL